MFKLENFVEVQMGESLKKVGEELNHFTRHLKPCLAVSIYDLVSRDSYLGHYPDLSFYDFIEDVKNVKKDFKNNIVFIYCAGGSLEAGKTSYNEAIKQDQELIEKTLEKYFPLSRKVFDWSEECEVVDFYLDKMKREVFVNKEKY